MIICRNLNKQPYFQDNGFSIASDLSNTDKAMNQTLLDMKEVYLECHELTLYPLVKYKI